jgi:ectoine hydroxylase-related dioxygenase (phytanoyl-CoA dioxygenase family)|tara:strand:+ start:425 stop:1279 length:855 start_codon:yes stop_codon:yes gene_type:complete
MKLKDLVFYKKNGFLIKKNLIDDKEISKINKIIKKILNEGKKNRNDELFVYNNKSKNDRNILRIKDPHNVDKLFYKLSRNNKIISIVSKLLGGTVRFHHSKLNFKLPSNMMGGLIDWHQDWAFYPHTNDDLLAVGIYLENCEEVNGPLKVIPGSHNKKLYNHHSNNEFVGKIELKKEKINIKNSISLTGKSGTVTFHHVRTIHGSGLNLTDNLRPLLLFGYAAVDAWPLTSDSSADPNLNFNNYNDCIIKGSPTLTPRIKKVPIRIPLPRINDSIYDMQKRAKI